jgi:hypothetical protein
MRQPSRHNLKRFGVDGRGCQRCYVRLKSRARAGLVVDPMVVLRRWRGCPAPVREAGCGGDEIKENARRVRTY